MEFKFNLNNLFKSPISVINYTLLPSDFPSDRRDAGHCAAQIADVIDEMGVASAKAQHLQPPITSSEKLRNSDHTLYLLIDPEENQGKGSAIGLLKVGVKNLFLVDETGMVHEKKTLCVLDFYVYESKQRKGYGKKLYDYMLRDQNIQPFKLALDQPPEEFLSFLFKYYGQAKIYPQNNNFVLFEGFFNDKSDHGYVNSTDNGETTDRVEKDERNCYDNHSVQSLGYKPTEHGRHTASRQQDTMGKFLGEESYTPEKSSRHFGMTQTQHTTLW